MFILYYFLKFYLYISVDLVERGEFTARQRLTIVIIIII